MEIEDDGLRLVPTGGRDGEALLAPSDLASPVAERGTPGFTGGAG